MKTILNILLFIIAVTVAGCQEQQNPNIHLREGVGSDNLIDNIVTRPVAYAFSALAGEGIDVTEAITKRNDSGFMELYVSGFNRSYSTRVFRYRVEWLDESGMAIQNKTSVWLSKSAMGKSPFSIKAVAPRQEAVNFRMDTRK